MVLESKICVLRGLVPTEGKNGHHAGYGLPCTNWVCLLSGCIEPLSCSLGSALLALVLFTRASLPLPLLLNCLCLANSCSFLRYSFSGKPSRTPTSTQIRLRLSKIYFHNPLCFSSVLLITFCSYILICVTVLLVSA